MRAMLAFRARDDMKIRVFVGESDDAGPESHFHSMLLTVNETRSLRDTLSLELELYDLRQQEPKENDDERRES